MGQELKQSSRVLEFLHGCAHPEMAPQLRRFGFFPCGVGRRLGSAACVRSRFEHRVLELRERAGGTWFESRDGNDAAKALWAGGHGDTALRA